MAEMAAAFHKPHGQSTEAHGSILFSPNQAHAATLRFRHHRLCDCTPGCETADQHGFPQQPRMSEQQHAPDEATNWPPSRRYAAPPRDFDMLPPVPSAHASWQELHDYAQSHASEHGYALSINTTAKNRSRIKLACVCYGQPKNNHKLTPETRVRKNRASYKTGCRMWIDGKKQENGMWVLRIGEAQHNHEGRASEDWAVQRKRTWGVVGGRVGVGGVTAQEEASQCRTARKDTEATAQQQEEGEEATSRPIAAQKFERGGLVWRIVEQEMLRKGEPGLGRDRGVGRTVEVLEARLPGIHIFKRDVYNIRAQIRRARKAAGQQLGQGLGDGGSNDDDDDDDDDDSKDNVDEEDVNASPTRQAITRVSSTPPSRPLTPSTSTDVSTLAQPTDPVPPAGHADYSTSTSTSTSASASASMEHMPAPAAMLARYEAYEMARLRQENAELRRLLREKTDEVKKKSIEIASLRSQAEYIAMVGMGDDRPR